MFAMYVGRHLSTICHNVYDTTVHVLRDIPWMLVYGEECTIPADVMFSSVQHYKAPLIKWIWQTLEHAL